MRPTGANTTISSNPLDEIDPYFILNGAVTFQATKNIAVQLTANNLLNNEYFHPGVRSANGGYYASALPQNEFNMMGRVFIDF